MLYGKGTHNRKNSLPGVGKFTCNRKIIQE